MASLATNNNNINNKYLNEPKEWDYFISHKQSDSKDIAGNLYSMEKIGKSCWLDVKMHERDEAAMEEGIKLKYCSCNYVTFIF